MDYEELYTADKVLVENAIIKGMKNVVFPRKEEWEYEDMKLDFYLPDEDVKAYITCKVIVVYDYNLLSDADFDEDGYPKVPLKELKREVSDIVFHVGRRIVKTDATDFSSETLEDIINERYAREKLIIEIRKK